MARRGDWAAFASGVNMGRQLYDDYDAAVTRQGLSDASQANTVSEGAVGEEISQEQIDTVQKAKGEAFNKARDEAIEKNRASEGEQMDPEQAGLEAAKQYDPALEELNRRKGMDKPDVRVMRKGTDTGKMYSTREEAQAAASAANQKGMADVYRQRGRPEAAEHLNRTAMKTEAAGLELKQMKRGDAIGEKRQGLELGNVENQIALQKTDYQNKLASGVLQKGMLQKAVLGDFADDIVKNPAVANAKLKDPDFLRVAGIKDADYIPGTKDGVMFTLADGTKARTTASAIKEWSHGKGELKMQVIGEGGMGVITDGHGNEINRITNPKAADGSKNDAAMDDAAGVMDKVLEANKTMMTQFGGRETEVRQSAVLEHNKGIGEFKRTAGRAPTREEAAIIAEGAMKKAMAQPAKK